MCDIQVLIIHSILKPLIVLSRYHFCICKYHSTNNRYNEQQLIKYYLILINNKITFSILINFYIWEIYS